jgi:hypothetical protein
MIFMNVELQILNPRHRFLRCFTQRVSLVLALALFSCVLDLRAQPTNNDSGPTIESFHIISQRNIFDPNRRGIPKWHPQEPDRNPDILALVGTMSYPKGKFAFFDGSKTDYKKVLEPGATIAGYTVKDITPKDVTLAANGKELTLKVGSQMRKEQGKSDWQPSTQTDLPSTSDTNTGSSGSASDQSMPSGVNPAASDTIKRLMEQRQQLLK